MYFGFIPNPFPTFFLCKHKFNDFGKRGEILKRKKNIDNCKSEIGAL